ncbi:MAG: 1-acyl-sn-glycerol-3-phosphate acyltransferase [Verrucomicrobia bacterium]|nr:MAG: 1-acyl-sn-glycerol-3-phosphate acyltransferase [Verrucomicrobiota bacterium]
MMRSLPRLVCRAVWLAGALSWSGVDFIFTAWRSGCRASQHTRALWLQRTASRVGRVVIAKVEISGNKPRPGLLVSNHLSYVDILLLGSIVPAVFVSKAEVKNWPVFGWFGRLGGTIFVDRTRRGDVARIAETIAAHLRDGHVVVLFPEGTSSDGSGVLPFRSSLLEPVSGAAHDLFAARIEYFMPEGSVENDVCYWGDMTFFPHLVKLLGKPRIKARVTFSEVESAATDRKELARQLHAEVRRLKGGGTFNIQHSTPNVEV